MNEEGLNYVPSCRGAWYKWWPQDLDYPPERSPSWSSNDSPPDPSEFIAEGCFCAGMPNLMLRAEGKKIPDHIGDEDTHRLLMECYVRLGQRARALRQYKLCEQVLMHECDMMPSPETWALYTSILKDGGPR